jgi:hypothetical protein
MSDADAPWPFLDPVMFERRIPAVFEQRIAARFGYDCEVVSER